MKLLEEAATLARQKDRSRLLESTREVQVNDQKDKVFLITTFHPTDQALRQIVLKNWDLLGKSPTTSFLHEKKLMVGYRRPKNLRDILVKANLPFLPGDDKAIPEALKDKVLVEAPQIEQPRPTTQQSEPIQKTILNLFCPVARVIPNVAIQQNTTKQAGVPNNKKYGGTPAKNRGFNFCNTRNCRYCPNLDKTGEVTSSVTGRKYRCMKNVSCRSSNLIYCITCKTCNKQYVGQTSLRLKSRFVHHYYTVDKKDTSKPVGKHFSQANHRGTDDMRIHIVEFIKKPPHSDMAVQVRNKVEKRWIHLLRSPAPQGLNIED